MKAVSDEGFFLSPSGKLVPLKKGASHIGMVLSYPSKFGLTKKKIENVYDQHDETIGIEGEAREDILKGLMDKGWVRIRRYRDRYWSFQFDRMNPKVGNLANSWAFSMLKGAGGYKEKDKYMDVKLMGMKDGYYKQLGIFDIAKTAMSLKEDCHLLEVVEIENI